MSLSKPPAITTSLAIITLVLLTMKNYRQSFGAPLVHSREVQTWLVCTEGSPSGKDHSLAMNIVKLNTQVTRMLMSANQIALQISKYIISDTSTVHVTS